MRSLQHFLRKSLPGGIGSSARCPHLRLCQSVTTGIRNLVCWNFLLSALTGFVPTWSSQRAVGSLPCSYMYSSTAASDVPAGGRAFMAYQPVASSFKSTTPTAKLAASGVRGWDDVRKEARKLEGELDVKLAAYAKLCSGFEANYRHRSGDASSIGADQLAQTKAAELEDLLQRLSDLNHEMSGLIGGISDSRSHTLARHRDILQEFTQEFRRLNSTLGAARDRVQLLSGSSTDSPHIGLTLGGATSTGALLRERQTIQTSTNAVDDILKQAQAVSGNLLDQRRMFEGITDKLEKVGTRFPVVNSLLNAIRRKKSKDTLVLTGVIAACILFTLLYIWFR